MATVRAPASAGYCRLRLVGATPDNPEAIKNEHPSVKCIGSGATANMGASLFETYLTATAETKMLLEHQAGSNPAANRPARLHAEFEVARAGQDQPSAGSDGW